MSLSLYESSVPVYERGLNAFLAILDKAEEHAKARKFDANNYLAMRLSPDMWPLVRQVQGFCDHAKNSTFRLAAKDPPRKEDKEATVAELRDRIHATLDMLKSIDAKAMEGAETREIVIPTGATNKLKIPRRRLPSAFRLAKFLFSSDHRVRHPAREWRRNRQAATSWARSPTSFAFEAQLPERLSMTITRFHAGPRMSQAVIHGSTIYLAGQVADQAKGKSVGEQTKEILAIIDRLLGEAGSDKTKLLSTTIYLADIGTFAEMNAVWDAWIPCRPRACSRHGRGKTCGAAFHRRNRLHRGQKLSRTAAGQVCAGLTPLLRGETNFGAWLVDRQHQRPLRARGDPQRGGRPARSPLR